MYIITPIDAGQCFTYDIIDTGIWYIPWIEHVNKKKHDLQGNTYLQLETVGNFGTYIQERKLREFSTQRQNVREYFCRGEAIKLLV